MSDYFDKDPQNPRWPTGGGGNIGAGSGGIKADKVLFSGDTFPAIILKVGSTEYGGRTSEDINDPWVIEDEYDLSGGEGLDHEWYIEGGDHDSADPTETINQQDWFGPAGGDGEGGFIPVIWKEKDFGVRAFDPTDT